MTGTGSTNISVVRRIAGTVVLMILFYFFKYEALFIRTISLKCESLIASMSCTETKGFWLENNPFTGEPELILHC